MRLDMVSHGGQVIIEKPQMARWNRIAQILRRNGVRIQMQAAGGGAASQLWWFLPFLGAMIFIGSLLAGPSIVNAIWEPPAPRTPVLDLSGGTVTPSATPGLPGGSADSGIDTSFLQDALKSTREQENITQDLNLDTSQYVDRPEVSEGVIRDYGRQALLQLQVEESRRAATLLHESGLLLVDSAAITEAFQRQIRTVEEAGSLYQKAEFVVPEVFRPGEDPVACVKRLDSQNVGVTLLEAPLQSRLEYEINYDLDLDVGNLVWIASYLGNDLNVERVSVVSSVKNFGDVDFWVVEAGADSDLGPNDTGAPVFNPQGELTGMFIQFQGQKAVLSLKRLRERAPQVFREVIN